MSASASALDAPFLHNPYSIPNVSFSSSLKAPEAFRAAPVAPDAGDLVAVTPRSWRLSTRPMAFQ
jgi:hypothetical protein